MEPKPKQYWAMGKDKHNTSQPTLRIGLPKRLKPRTMDQTVCPLRFKDYSTMDHVQGQVPC